MPRYKYACEKCKSVDVRKFKYASEEETDKAMPTCLVCEIPLKRSLITTRPPIFWD